MKLRQTAFLSVLASASAFSVAPPRAKTTKTPRLLFSAVANNDFETAAVAGSSVSILEQLGIEDGKLALGVKPDEVLKYIGT